MKVPLPDGSYIKNIAIEDDGLDVEFAPRKKVALLFVSVNNRYWPYLSQVIKDCKEKFMPQHTVSYHVWTDIPELDSAEYAAIDNTEFFSAVSLREAVQYLRTTPGIEIHDTGAIQWPAPTLMRYHLFLNEEEKLKEYDFLYYLDADMRVVDKISDEVLTDGLLAAEHPMYSLRKEYVPPYEPNKASTAYIPRPGAIITDEKGNTRFKPYYYAGGFQGGLAGEFITAMQTMKANIDKDFNNNYTAIWNDESHWNKYLFDYTGKIVVLSPSYIYPDSLIKEYYENVWGKSYEPKIITLTKPFSLSKQGADELNEFFGGKMTPNIIECPDCRGRFDTRGEKVRRIVKCNGAGTVHELDIQKP